MVEVPGRVSFWGEARAVMIAVTWVSFFGFQKYYGLLQNLGFVKAGLSRKPSNHESRVIAKYPIIVPQTMAIVPTVLGETDFCNGGSNLRVWIYTTEQERGSFKEFIAYLRIISGLTY